MKTNKAIILSYSLALVLNGCSVNMGEGSGAATPATPATTVLSVGKALPDVPAEYIINGNKVALCHNVAHNPHVNIVSINALPAHLGHLGDYLLKASSNPVAGQECPEEVVEDDDSSHDDDGDDSPEGEEDCDDEEGESNEPPPSNA